MSQKLIIRVRSPAGTERVELADNDNLFVLREKLKLTYPQYTDFTISKSPDGKSPLVNDSLSLGALQIRHGDMLFLKPTGKEEVSIESSPSNENETEEDEVDKYLETQDGWIQRDRDPKFCNHGPKGKCSFCMPIAPWSILDIDPWKSEGIKFLPFHAFVRKMQANAGCKHPEGQRCLNCKSLEQPSYKIKECKKHAPWPQGMCTECDPGTISLNGQPYRHTDHVEFESMQVVDSFIQFWRETALQRCGYLYGKYIPDKTIPLGIRAVVMAIYEPPQKDTKEEAVLDKNDPNAEKVEQLASLLGMERIGFIWTDLKVDKKDARKDLLYSSEIIRIARMQNKHPSPCKQAMGGKMGSKFVSVLVTTTEKGDVELQAYQVSDQCMSLASAGLITYSKKDKTQMKAKKASGTNYRADIIYRKVDKYGANVMGKADPNFPPEYFIISVRHGAPKEPKPFFKKHQFTPENRKPNLSLAMYKSQTEKQVLEALSDFHLLVYLSSQVDAKSLKSITQYLIKRDNEAEVKAIFAELLKAVKAPAPASAPAPTPTTIPSRSGSARTGEVTKKEQDIINQLTSMGYSPTQAKEAVWATNSTGVEQALDFLLRS